MDTIRLPSHFKEFLRLLNAHHVEYMLIGGYAVNFYGYPRATADIDFWVGLSTENAQRAAAAVQEFGFTQAVPAQIDGVPVTLISREDLKVNK